MVKMHDFKQLYDIKSFYSTSCSTFFPTQKSMSLLYKSDDQENASNHKTLLPQFLSYFKVH
jgi:hypothetical protein